jgi:hypothetical protein
MSTVLLQPDNFSHGLAVQETGTAETTISAVEADKNARSTMIRHFKLHFSDGGGGGVECPPGNKVDFRSMSVA